MTPTKTSLPSTTNKRCTFSSNIRVTTLRAESFSETANTSGVMISRTWLRSTFST